MGTLAFRNVTQDPTMVFYGRNFPLHLVTVPSTTAQLEINISDCFSTTTATCQTGGVVGTENVVF